MKLAVLSLLVSSAVVSSSAFEQPPAGSAIPMPAAVVGLPYSEVMATAAGTPPFRWSADGLPAGLSMNSAGRISGTPTVPNYMGKLTDKFSAYAVQVTDANGVSSRFVIRIVVYVPLEMATSPLPAATVGAPYTACLSAKGGAMDPTIPRVTATVTDGSMPDGLALSIPGAPDNRFNAQQCAKVTPRPMISGVPTKAGTWHVAFAVSDGIQTVPFETNIVVNKQ